MKKRMADIVLVGFLLLFMFGFGIWSWVNPDEKFSTLENRNLSMRPDANLDNVKSGEYFKRFETYYNDQFSGREFFIEVNANVDKYLYQKDVIRSIYVHDDGYLINPVNPETGLKTKEITDKVNDFASNLKKENVDVYFALAPNKATLMEYKLPNYVIGRGNELSDTLMDNFSRDVNGIDLRSTIKPHLNEPNMYFYTDHHWKPKAAHYAYEKIINDMNKEHPEIGNPVPKEQYEWKEDPALFYGSDARKTTTSFVKYPDTLTIVKPKFKEKSYSICYRSSCGHDFYDMSYLEEDDNLYENRYRVYFSGDVGEGVITNPNSQNGEKVLILKDSYVNPMIQFVARNFSETRILDLRHYKQKSVYKYIKEHDIDSVLFVHNIDSLHVTPSFLDFDNPGGGENR